MYKYRVTLTIEDEVIALTDQDAWDQFSKRVQRGYYGPTKDNVEFIEEIPEAETVPLPE